MAKSESGLSVEETRKLLKEKTLRCTACRISVLQFLSQSQSPLSHNDVAEVLVPRGFDKSTVYRCLVELSEAGIFNRLELGDHTWRFEFKRHTQDGTHPHFVCTDCGTVECMPEIELKIPKTSSRDLSDQETNIKHVQEVLLKGQCKTCR